MVRWSMTLSTKGCVPRIRVRCDQDVNGPRRLRAICMSGMAAEAQIARWAGFDAVVSPRQIELNKVLLDMLGHHDSTCLVSFGLAGGLAPGLRPGDVLISTHVITTHQCWRPPPKFRERMLGLARELGALEGAVLSSSTVIASPQEKAGAWRETGALAVDMESAVVASTANTVGIPFVVMRAIADPATQKLPPAAGISFASERGISVCALLIDLLARPRQIPAICTVASQAFRGLLGLSRAARMLPVARSFRSDLLSDGGLDRARVGGRQDAPEWSERSAPSSA